jgi:hypothetical protein
MKAENTVRDYSKMKGAKKERLCLKKGRKSGVTQERYLGTLLLKRSKSHVDHWRLSYAYRGPAEGLLISLASLSGPCFANDSKRVLIRFSRNFVFGGGLLIFVN